MSTATDDLQAALATFRTRKRMKVLLGVAQAAGTPEVGEQIVAELRERFRRRTALIARMDRARLP